MCEKFVEIMCMFFVDLYVVDCIDKWLWCVCFFKMCSLVMDVCCVGSVEVGGYVVKLFCEV